MARTRFRRGDVVEYHHESFPKFEVGDIVEYHHESFPKDHSVYIVAEVYAFVIQCIPIVEMDTDYAERHRGQQYTPIDPCDLILVRRDDADTKV